MVFTGKTRLFTTGFSRMSERQYGVWDAVSIIRFWLNKEMCLSKIFFVLFCHVQQISVLVYWFQKNLSKPLRLDTIDCSSGVLFPYYDHDTRVVFVAGKVCSKWCRSVASLG